MNIGDVEKQHFSVDKSTWGDGPWTYEPDRLDFEHEGLSCLLHRGPSGHWCGYCGVPRSHPSYGQKYDDVAVDVHGGLTYSDKCDGTICHIPKPGDSDEVWWFGFDCAHSGDFSPSYSNAMRGRTGERPYSHAHALLANTWRCDTYRTLEYVKAETESLARQLRALDPLPVEVDA